MLGQRAARCANLLALAGITAILTGAFVVQFARGELPCPLCNLQRAAFLAMAAGPALNLAFGARPRHYGLTLLAAVLGAIFSGRQMLLHITPGDPGYGAPLFGVHLYSWAFGVFVLAIVLTAVMLVLGESSDVRPSKRLARLALAPLALLAALGAGATLLQCGFGLCPDNPAHYRLLQPAPNSG